MTWAELDEDMYVPYYNRRTFLTVDFIEKVLQSVFHTLTIVAAYEIIKETFRRLEVIRLRMKVQKYEKLARYCCLSMYGCKTCECCILLNAPRITYRAVPSAIYRALEAKTTLWKKHTGIQGGYMAAKCRTPQEEILYLNQYLDDVTANVREICAERDYETRENLKRYELMKRQRELEFMLGTMREERLCPCAVGRTSSNPCSSPRHPRNSC